jgi:hypothetical protein
MRPGASAVPPGPLPTNQNPLEGGGRVPPFLHAVDQKTPTYFTAL